MKKNIIHQDSTEMQLELVRDCLRKKGVYSLHKVDGDTRWVVYSDDGKLRWYFTQSLIRNPVFCRILEQH